MGKSEETMENSTSTAPTPTYNLKGYIQIFVTQQISIFGSNIVQFALIWWLSSHYGRNIVLSMATIMGILPLVLISPFAGVIADRWSRKKLMVLSDFTQALATGILILLFALNVAQLIHIYFLLAIRGLVQGIQIPASYSVMSSMVPPQKISKMNSLNSVTQSLLSILSPALGAIAVGYFSIETIFWLDVISFFPAALVMLLVYIPDVEQSEELKSTKIHVFKEMHEALSCLSNSQLGRFVILFALLNVFINPMFSLLPKLISTYYNAEADMYSLILIGFQGGYLLAAGLMTKTKTKFPRIAPLMRYGVLITLMTGIFYFVPKQILWSSAIITGVIGFFIALLEIKFTSILQIVIPKNMQGRVFSSYFLLIKSILPLSLVLWGFMADITNIHIVYLISPLIASLLVGILLITTKTDKIEVILSNLEEKEPNSKDLEVHNQEQKILA